MILFYRNWFYGKITTNPIVICYIMFQTFFKSITCRIHANKYFTVQRYPSNFDLVQQIRLHVLSMNVRCWCVLFIHQNVNSCLILWSVFNQKRWCEKLVSVCLALFFFRNLFWFYIFNLWFLSFFQVNPLWYHFWMIFCSITHGFVNEC